MPLPDLSDRALAAYLDHTCLSPDQGPYDAARACVTAAAHRCAGVCLRPQDVATACEALTDDDGTRPVRIVTVVGFPSGAVPTAEKVAETVTACAAGADEVDMVLDYQALITGDLDHVAADIAAVRAACAGKVLKVILETATLTDAQIITACQLCEAAGADFVKTSTGFHPAGGASVEAVALMRATVPTLGVKASGGISTREKALAMIAAGATRIGTSATAAMFGGGEPTGSY